MINNAKTKILLIFLVLIVAVAPLLILFPQVTAITDKVYREEEGKLADNKVVLDESYVGMGYGNAFDMFGEVTVNQESATEPEVPTTKSTVKQYKTASKKNDKTPTEPGSEEEVITTESQKLIPYEKVGKNMDSGGHKLRTLTEPSAESKSKQLSAGYLIAIKNPDSSYAYNVIAVKMTEKDKDIAGRLIMGEAGSMGFYGCCLVAQAMRDTYYYGNFKSIESVRVGYGYDGKLKNKPNAAAKKALKYILEEGHSAVQHRILYFYNPRLCVSNFHEGKNYLLTYKDVRFFD